MPPVTSPGNVLIQSLSVHVYCVRGLFSENEGQVSGEVSGDVSGDGQSASASGDGQSGSDPSNADGKLAMELVVMQAQLLCSTPTFMLPVFTVLLYY